MIRVLEQDLELMPYPSPWGNGRWSYSGIPFTGIAFENWEGTQILMNESEYIGGYEEGVQREYHQNGQIRIEYYNEKDGCYEGILPEILEKISKKIGKEYGTYTRSQNY